MGSLGAAAWQKALGPSSDSFVVRTGQSGRSPAEKNANASRASGVYRELYKRGLWR
jgi:hypothetical protein